MNSGGHRSWIAHLEQKSLTRKPRSREYIEDEWWRWDISFKQVSLFFSSSSNPTFHQARQDTAASSHSFLYREIVRHNVHGVHQQDMKLLPFHFSNTCTFIENIITPVYVSGCTFVPFHAVFKRSNCFCVCGEGEPPSRNKRGIMLADTFVNRPSRLAEEHTWIPLKRVKQSWVFLIKSDVLPIWRMSYWQSSSRNIPHTKRSCQNFFKYSSPSESPPKSF